MHPNQAEDVEMHGDSAPRRVLTVTLEDQRIEQPPGLGPCAAPMTVGGRRRIGGNKKHYATSHPGSRYPCPNPATRIIDGQAYCATHGPSRFRIDPYYDSLAWRTLRQQTLERDDFVCQYCGNPAHQADHVIPRSKGGLDALSNLVACCRDCNKIAAGAFFNTFQEKKAWIVTARKRLSPKKNDRRPKELLDLLKDSRS